jgi:SAM-dependent methyltransferase
MPSWRLWLHASRTLGCLLLFLHLPLSATKAGTHADCERQYTPRSGEPGKDVMWVATLDEVVTSMLRAARVTEKDTVVDLGSGDGKIPIAAAKQFGATALGIEYNPQLVQLARCYARAERVEDKVRFEQGDIFEADFSHATVVTLYLGPTVNLKLRPRLLSMRPGTRIVPARIEGEWRFVEAGGKASFAVRLQQRFQHLQPSPATESHLAVHGGRLVGKQVELVVEGLDAQPVKLTGELNGDRLLVAQTRDGAIRRFVGAPQL